MNSRTETKTKANNKIGSLEGEITLVEIKWISKITINTRKEELKDGYLYYIYNSFPLLSTW